ncbi:MAG: DUF2336 domain-containing protein, partial [Alphaproteobacteria bacterium]|nr:DUF2336 domain-containing protein [Alphaproteobacteria bacterium]
MSSTSASNLRAQAAALQELARHETRKSRTELAHTIVGLLDHSGSEVGRRERELAYDILHKLVLGTEIAVRREIALILSEQADAPHALIAMLANDQIDVAFPVIVKSPALTEDDLLELARVHTVRHQRAVASRPNIGENICDALISTEDRSVVVTLLHNKSARIPAKSMEHLVEQSREIEAYRAPLLDRDDLDPALGLRMFFWVSTVLRDHIIQKFSVEPALVENLIGQVIANEMRRIAEEKRS